VEGDVDPGPDAAADGAGEERDVPLPPRRVPSAQVVDVTRQAFGAVDVRGRGAVEPEPQRRAAVPARGDRQAVVGDEHRAAGAAGDEPDARVGLPVVALERERPRRGSGECRSRARAGERLVDAQPREGGSPEGDERDQ
jgi:hypothetical protein